jgi:hypothetical protein
LYDAQGYHVTGKAAGPDGGGGGGPVGFIPLLLLGIARLIAAAADGAR